jgi:GMP synthase-like glutamine amidotransferase
MKLGLLLCDDVSRRFRHIAGGYGEMFDALLKPQIPGVQWQHYDVRKGELPDSTDECDAWLCTGSRHSVYEGEAWIGRLKDFVRDLQATRKPFVGICFGHQVLAEALGGKVARSSRGWGVGVREMTIAATEGWMQPPLARVKLQYMHADQVETLPPGAVVLGYAPHCEIALFRVGDRMLGIEGHPEFPAAYERALLEIREQHIGSAEVQAALATIEEPTDERIVAQWIARFLRLGA